MLLSENENVESLLLSRRLGGEEMCFIAAISDVCIYLSLALKCHGLL